MIETRAQTISLAGPASGTTLLKLLETVASTRSEAALANLAVVERKLTAGAMPALHVHEDDEAVYVFEGAMTVYAGDESIRLEAGDAFVAPRGVPHTYRSDSEGVRFLAMAFVRSSARYEDFQRAVARPTADVGAGGGSWPNGEEAAGLVTIAGANGITILGPPGALPTDLESARASHTG